MTTEEGFVEVEIIKWEKYNPRGDVKKPSWFRVEYSLLEDPDFYDFTHEEFVAWFYVMAQACRKNQGAIRLNYGHALATRKLSRRAIDGALEKLKGLGILKVHVTHPSRGRDADVTDTNATERNGTERDGTERDETERDAATSGRARRRAAPPMLASPDLADPLTDHLIGGVKPDVQKAWVDTYGADWVKQELRQAMVWCKANPKRAPKSDYGRFLTSWLSRGWERHRKGIPTTFNRAEQRSRGNAASLAAFQSSLTGIENDDGPAA